MKSSCEEMGRALLPYLALADLSAVQVEQLHTQS